MTRLNFITAALACALVAAAAPQLASAGHWYFFDGTYPHHIDRGHLPSLSFYNRALNGSWTALEHARGDWSADQHLDLYNLTSDGADVVAWDGYFCTDWSGLASFYNQYGGNHFQQGRIQINVCDGYAAAANYNGTRAVACQEIGHVIGGMNHQGPGCMGAGYQGEVAAGSNNMNDPQVRSPSAHDREHTGHLWWTLH